MVMTVVERPEQVEWAVQHLRTMGPEVPFTLISDGRHEERYARIAEAYGGGGFPDPAAGWAERDGADWGVMVDG